MNSTSGRRLASHLEATLYLCLAVFASTTIADADEPAPLRDPARFAHRSESSASIVRFVQPPDNQDQPGESNEEGELDEEADLPPIAELEQLLQEPVQVPAFEQEVSIVTGQQSTVGKSPAAVFVVTSEMIRQSGARSIPEVLRMVPGLQVARVNSHQWSITARGFGTDVAGLFAANNKLLVLIDGRTVYSPLFSGVFWDVQDVLLADIERIEVVRGPGATIWGANAVNGVINIITKKAKDTQGGFVEAGGGTEENGFVSARRGGRLGDDAHYRLYGKWFDRGPTDNPTGSDFDQWQQGRGGFRVDWMPSSCDNVTLQGDIYEGRNGLFANAPFSSPDPVDDVRGGNLLLRWDRSLAEDSDLSLQFYYDRADRSNTNLQLAQQVNTYDATLRHNFAADSRNNIVWGMGFRSIQDQLTPLVNPPFIFFEPGSRTYDTFSAFVQDEIALIPDELTATIGIKLLTSALADFEYQPSARVLWSPEPTWAMWAAVSRAVRTPARVEHDLIMRNFVGGPDPLVQLSEDFHSENMIAYELGYRAQPVEGFSWDIAVFFNQYESLESFHFVPTGGGPPGRQVINRNQNRGEGYGVELSAQADLTPWWRMSGWYSFMQLQIHPTGPLPPADATGGPDVEGSSPHNQAFLMSTIDLTCDVELDLLTRYVDSLPFQRVPSYITMDARLAWRPNDCTELSVVGQNLLDSRHLEFGNGQLPGAGGPVNAIPRGVYAMLQYEW